MFSKKRWLWIIYDIEKDCERGECDHMCVCNALYDPHCCTDKYGNDIDYSCEGIYIFIFIFIFKINLNIWNL